MVARLLIFVQERVRAPLSLMLVLRTSGLLVGSGTYPTIYLPIARRTYRVHSPEVINSKTELVIGGYIRSANTFAVYAFQLSFAGSPHTTRSHYWWITSRERDESHRRRTSGNGEV